MISGHAKASGIWGLAISFISLWVGLGVMLLSQGFAALRRDEHADAAWDNVVAREGMVT